MISTFTDFYMTCNPVRFKLTEKVGFISTKYVIMSEVSSNYQHFSEKFHRFSKNLSTIYIMSLLKRFDRGTTKCRFFQFELYYSIPVLSLNENTISKILEQLHTSLHSFNDVVFNIPRKSFKCFLNYVIHYFLLQNTYPQQ